MKFTALLGKLFGLSLMGALLASCYLPARFDAEIELDKAGYYSVKFDGYLADLSLYQGLKDGKISREEEKDKIEVIERDFKRDTATKEFQYFKQGHFKLKWEITGDLLKNKTMTFIRRNELIFQLKYVENSGYIVLEGASISKDNRQRLLDMGLNMQGQIRVKTDLPIKSDNATSKKKDPRDPRFTWLVWDVESIKSPRPRAVFIIE